MLLGALGVKAAHKYVYEIDNDNGIIAVGDIPQQPPTLP